MYGVHAATTVLPMLAEFYYGPGTDSQKQVRRALTRFFTFFVCGAAEMLGVGRAGTGGQEQVNAPASQRGGARGARSWCTAGRWHVHFVSRRS